MHIAYFEDDGVTPVTEETAAAVRAAADALRAQGFTVSEWRPRNLERVWQLWWNLFGRGVQMAFAPTVEGREAELSPMYTAFRAIVAAQGPLGAQELLNTLLGRDALRAMLLEKMEEFPILLSPVCAIPAFKHGERKWTVRGKEVEYLKAMSYSQWFNILGLPAGGGAVCEIGGGVADWATNYWPAVEGRGSVECGGLRGAGGIRI